MRQLKVKAKVDRDGILTAQLPVETAGMTVDVIVDLPRKDARSEAEFLALLAESFGSIPDLVRPEQGELPSPVDRP